MKRYKAKDTPEDERKRLEEIFTEKQPLHFFEVKTLLTSPDDRVRLNSKALARKERWAERYGAVFHVAAFDDRRGRKNTGTRVYVAPNQLSGTFRLANMKKAADLAGVLAHAGVKPAAARNLSTIGESESLADHSDFERAIDENPLESHNHLVFADFLDEKGDHDEAAFRRAMGEWVRAAQEKGVAIHRPVKATRRNASHGEVKFPWVVPIGHTPEGVDTDLLPTWNRGEFWEGNRTFFRGDGTGYWPQDPTHGHGTHAGIGYATYRNMAAAIRRAFLANRKRKEAT